MVFAEMILPLLGGGLIGLAAIFLMLLNGRIAGISGIIRGVMTQRKGGVRRIFFIAGLVLSGVFAKLLFAPVYEIEMIALPFVLLAGFLVGAGAGFGDGCTSGHGICGIGRLSIRSIAATSVFMTTGVLAAMIFH